jgi:hypothetical protein
MHFYPWKHWLVGSIPFQTNSILAGKQCGRFSTFKRRWFSMTDTCVSSAQLNRPIWTKCVFSTLKSLFGSQFFFQKLIQFSARINVLHASHSNIDAFLFRDTCGSSTQLNRPIWQKMCVFPLENPDSQVLFPSKTHSILTVKQCVRCSYF